MLALFALVACGPAATSPDAPAPATATPATETSPVLPVLTPPEDPAVAGAEAMYAPDHVVRIDVTMDPADAEALSAETNDLFTFLQGEDCLDSPWTGPFQWYPADLVIDGVAVPEVGVRKKGLIGSLSTTKPSLKVDFDTYVDGQRYDGLERLTLNNSVSDPSLVRQCLGYDLFRAAGLASPRCHFAHLTGGGDDLGVYVSVEPVKKDFLAWAFDGDADGDLYEGTLADLRAGWLGTFEADTNATDPGKAHLHAVADALALPDDAAMLAALEPLVDLDAFYRFWAMEVLIGHVDGYTGNTNNYYVYVPERTGRLVFVPWGIDATFRDLAEFGSDTTAVVLANSQLSRRLWEVPEARARYLATLQELLDTVWHEAHLLAEIDRMEALTAPLALPDGGLRAADVNALRAFVSGRRAALEAALALAPPTFDAPLRDSLCLVEAGSLRMDFDAPWDSLESVDPLGEGSCALTGTYEGLPFAYTGGAIAGEDGGYVVVGGLALSAPTVVRYGVAQAPTWAVAEGAVLPVTGLELAGLFVEIDFAVGEEAVILGSMWDGELVIDRYEPWAGGTVAGHLEGTVWSGGPF